MRRTLLVIGALLLAVLAALRLWPDDAPPDEAGLIPTPPALAAGEDGWGDFKALEKGLDVSLEERSFVTRQASATALSEPAKVEALLARNAAALEVFEDLAGRKGFSDPSFRDLAKVDHRTPIPQFHPVVTAARLTLLRSRLRLAAGRGGEALEDAERVLRAGRVFAGARSQVLETLIGMLLLEESVPRVEEAARARGVSPARRAAAAAQLARPTGLAASVQEGLRYEYAVASNALARLTRRPEGEADAGAGFYESAARVFPYLYLPNRTRGIYAARFREHIDAAGKPCGQNAVPPLEELRLDPRPNLVGRILLNIAIPSLDRLTTRRCAVEQKAAAASVALAAR
jgi:hypothetical protein